MAIRTSTNEERPEGRKVILREARRLFFTVGFAGTSVTQIAGATGMAKSAIYHHFTSKEALFQAVIRELVTELGLCLRENAKGATWTIRLASSAEGLARFLQKEGLDGPTILHNLGQLPAMDIIDLRDQLAPAVLGPLVQAIEDGMSAGEVRPIDPLWAAWLLVIMIGASLRPLTRNDTPEITRHTIELFLRGLGYQGEAG